MNEEHTGHAARLGDVGNGNVIADNHHLDFFAKGAGPFGGKAEIEPVTGIVWNDEKAAGLPVTATIAARTASKLGEANTSPQTAAVSMPLPTNPAWDGSWPDPPPEIIATLDEGRSVRQTTLMCG